MDTYAKYIYGHRELVNIAVSMEMMMHLLVKSNVEKVTTKRVVIFCSCYGFQLFKIIIKYFFNFLKSQMIVGILKSISNDR